MASILATAGTICFDARLGAGDLNPNGGATRAGLAACGVVAFKRAPVEPPPRPPHPPRPLPPQRLRLIKPLWQWFRLWLW